MKLSNAIVFLLSVSFVDAACKISGTYTLSGACNVGNLNAALGEGCIESLGLSAPEVCESLGVPFGDITQWGYRRDKVYFDGGTEVNNNDGDDSLKVEMGQVKRFQEGFAATHKVNWPEYRLALLNKDGPETPHPSNFDSCEHDTVMCCFVHDRFDGVIEQSAMNADVCYHDISSASLSNNIRRGFTVTRGDETSTYCTGFTWGDSDDADRFKGNMLYDVSLKKTLTEGLVKNVPGAPLCGCIEQMPVVTAADCVDISVSNEGGTLILETENSSVTGSIAADITYGDCSGKTLKEHAQTYNTDLADHIVPGCDEYIDEYLNNNFYVSDTEGRSSWMKIDESKWEQFAGFGIFWYPYGRDMDDGDAELRQLLANSPHPIIYRYCKGCRDSHKHLYYRRLTDIPENVNFLNQILNAFTNEANVLKEDFYLYNNYEDAVAGLNTTSFAYCENDAATDYGFPDECGETSKAWSQWNRYNGWTPSETYHHAFYVEKPSTGTP